MKLNNKTGRLVGKASVAIASVAVAATALGACSAQSFAQSSKSVPGRSSAAVASHGKKAVNDPSVISTIKFGGTTSGTATSTTGHITPPATRSDGTTGPAGPSGAGTSDPQAGSPAPGDVTSSPTKTAYDSNFYNGVRDGIDAAILKQAMLELGRARLRADVMKVAHPQN